MIVYGDLSFEEKLSSVIARVHSQARRCQDCGLEELRTLLIQSGQLEQGVEDFVEHHSHRNGRAPAPEICSISSFAREATDHAADAFFSAWAGASKHRQEHRSKAEACLRLCRSKIREGLAEQEPRLTIKVPEGFAFYALFPEQYCVSANKWARDHAGAWPKRVLVVGIRSIGTTLSAVVGAALKAQGWDVERLTVRPGGHPFQRRLKTKAPDLKDRGMKYALILGEGAGNSGSSIAAVAQWLEDSGISDIGIFPGHANGPGAAASEEVRDWWCRTTIYFTSLEQLRWKGLSLTEKLGADCGAGSEAHTLDLSSGHWRRHSFASEAAWPAVCPVFERMKLRFDGIAPLLCKFHGLGCLIAGEQTEMKAAIRIMQFRASEGLTPAPLGEASGFIVTRWVDGGRLNRSDAGRTEILSWLGNYIVGSSGEELTPIEAQRANERLTDMVYWNAREALGERKAERARRLWEGGEASEPAPAYGDGRMSPYEWVRTLEGKILKTDCAGHDCDHTLIGKQSILWDLAGTVVEWDLTEAQVEHLLRLLGRDKIKVHGEPLRLFCMAYAAFRVGMMSLALSGIQENESERERATTALRYYTARLEACL